MSSEKKKRVPVKKAKLSRRVVRKSATGQFIAQKASSPPIRSAAAPSESPSASSVAF